MEQVKLFYPPSQKTTSMPVNECESQKGLLLRRDVRPFLGRIIAAKLPNVNLGAKQNYLEGSTAKAVGLHF